MSHDNDKWWLRLSSPDRWVNLWLKHILTIVFSSQTKFFSRSLRGIALTMVILLNTPVLASQRGAFNLNGQNRVHSIANAISNGVGSSSRSNNGFRITDNYDTSYMISNGHQFGGITLPITNTTNSSPISTTSIDKRLPVSISTTSSIPLNISKNIETINWQKTSASSYGIGINRNIIEIIEDNRSGPFFDKTASKNVTALLGKTAYLNCRVKNLGNKTMLLQVSWVRHRDIHLLTVGRYTYTSDQRFRAIHQPQTEDWILQIKYPQHRDSGIYECQVSTTPHMSHYIHLNVVEPSTEIIGAPDLYIESGSTINLTCVIQNSPEPPAYIFWNHNNAIINYDSPRGGVSVVTNKGETTTSFLLIKSARPSDSGHYQCNPSNAKPKSVTVHVLNGEFPAAMQRAVPALHRMSPCHYFLVYLPACLFTLAFTK